MARLKAWALARCGGLSVAIVLVAWGMTGCAAAPEPIPVLEPETSTALPEEAPQVGNPELWDRVYAAAEADGHPRVGLLNRGDEALEVRLNLIRSARESIKITTYIWEDSEVVGLLLWELARAIKQRGVKVQLLTDHVSSISDAAGRARGMMFSGLYNVRVYNPLTESLLVNTKAFLSAGFKDFAKVNQRMHTKLMIVDDKVAITGGRNYGNEYFDANLNFSYLDRDVLVVGPQVAEAVAKFDEFWNDERVKDSRDLPDVKEEMEKIDGPVQVTRQSLGIYGLFDEIERRAGDRERIQMTFIEPLHAADRIEWVIDSPGKPIDEDGLSETAAALRRLVLQSRREILIQSPYLVIGGKAKAFFKEFRKEHPEVPVRISTNSLAAADHEPAYAMVYRQSRIHLQELDFDVHLLKPLPADLDEMMSYGPLLVRKPTPREAEHLFPQRFTYDDAAVVPFEITMADGSKRTFDSYRNPYTGNVPHIAIHAKSMVFDDVAFVGSYNFDPRSGNLNCEIGLAVYDAAVAAELKRELELAMAPRNAWVLAKRRYPPGVHEVNQLPHMFFDWFIVDPWPIRYGGVYELKPGAEPVPRDHPEFYERYQSVGDFPQVPNPGAAEFRVWMYKTLGPMLTPLL